MACVHKFYLVYDGHLGAIFFVCFDLTLLILPRSLLRILSFKLNISWNNFASLYLML